MVGVSCVIAACSSSPSSSTTTTSSSSGPSSANPYRVLDIQAETGATGVLGTGAVQAIQYAEQQINNAGGILGRKVETDFFDDQGSPVTALSILKRQLSAAKYDFIIAGTTSAENNPMLPTITASKILTMSVAGGVSVSGSANPYFFTGSGIETADPDAVMEYIANKLKDTTVGLLIQSGVAGQTEDAGYVQGFGQLGIKVVANVSFDPTAIDDTSELEQVEAAKPQVLVVAAFGAAAGYIAKDMVQLGYTPPTIGDDFIAASNIPALVPSSDLKNWDVVYNSSLTRPPSGVPTALASFYTALTNEFGSLKASINTYTTNWDMLQLAKWAADTTKSTNGATDVKELEKIASVSSSKSIPLLTLPGSDDTASNHSPVPFNVTQQVNPYFEVSAASSPEIDGTLALVSTIPDYPHHLVA
ncbi:MAG: ABC transporter substrate-binding protein, partial [Acidimicrobiales bacterium]